MRASDQFILRTIAGEQLLIPVGEAALQVKGLIALSESGALIFNKLKEGCTKEDLIETITSEYDVSEEKAAEDVDAFLVQLKQMDILLED